MSNFTDDEDRQLVQLAIAFSSCGKLIQWDRLAARMAHSVHSKDALRQRLKTLKRTHGKDLRKFPSWFFRKALFWDVPSRERRKSNAASSRCSPPSIEVVCRSHRVKKHRNYNGDWCWNVLPYLPLRQHASRPDAVVELPIVPNALPDCNLSPNTRMCDCYEDGTKQSSLALLADVAAQRFNHFSNDFL